MELISREHAIEHMRVLGGEDRERLMGILNNKNILPTIESRPKGKWIKESDYKVMGDGYLWDCSECGNRVYVDSKGLFPNYCEDCGADMRGEE